MTESLNHEIVTKYDTINFMVEKCSDRTRINFKSNFTDKLSFTIWISLQCDSCEIAANSNEDEEFFSYFWYCPMGMSSDKFTLEEIREFLFEYLDKIVMYKTRIVQNSMILWQTFRLEYLNNGVWHLIYKDSALNLGGIEFPELSGRKRIYY